MAISNLNTARPLKADAVTASGSAAPAVSVAEQLISQRIEEARRALWWSEITRTTLKVLIATMLAVLGWLVLDHWIYSPGPVIRSICFVALFAGVVWYFTKRAWPVMTSNVTSEYAAWALEKDVPDYRQQLTSYVTLNQEANRGIRARVVRVIGARAASLLKSNDALPGEATGTFRWWITAALIFAVLAGYCVSSPKSSVASFKRLAVPLASIDPAKRVEIRNVEPGNVSVLAGRDVNVAAEVEGLYQDEPVVCRWSAGGPGQEVQLQLDLSSDRFSGVVPLDHSDSGTIRYWIEAGDTIAGPFELNVENVPVVEIESVHYQPPAYTKQKARTTSSPAIHAIDGTTVRLSARTNRPVTRAELQFNVKDVNGALRATGGRVSIPIDTGTTSLVAKVQLRSARGNSASVELENYRIRVWDSNDQTNPDPIVYPIKVVPDLPPEVTIVVPKKSPKEIPVNGQQIIEVHAMDADFELQRVSISIHRGIHHLGDPVLWERPLGGSGRGNQVSEYRFRPLEYLLRVGDVVQVTAIAMDNREIKGDTKVSANQVSSDPIEFRIIEAEENLPDDPDGNDGVSKADNRPASDAKTGDESSGEGGAGGQESGAQGQGGKGESGQGSGGQNAGDQESEGSTEESEATGSGQGDSEGTESGDSQSESTGEDGSAGGESSAEESAMGADDPKPSGEQAGSEQAGSEQAGSEGESSESAGGTPEASGEDPGNQTSGDTGQTGSAQSDPTKGESPSEAQASEGAQQSDSTPSDANASPQGASEEAGGGQQGSSAPQHDAEAMERIKDYIERQQKQNDSKGAPNAPSDDAASDGAGNPSKSENKSDASPDTDSESNSESGSGSDSQDSKGQSEAASDDDSAEGRESGDEGRSADEQSTGSGVGGSEEGGQEGDDSQSNGDGEPEGSDQNGEAATDDDATTENPSGESPNQSDPSDSSSGSGGDPKESENNDASPSDPNQDASSDNGTESSQDSDSQSGDPASNSSASSQQGSGGQGSGNGTSEASDNSNAEPPPPPDLEYAKKATDMVLDYLDETRDQVDEDLLKELKWTQQDLQRFRERWEKVRELDQPTLDSAAKNDLEEALQSLGLTPKTSPSSSRDQAADSLRDLRDTGNRRAAPAAIRDAFEAFRRNR